MENHKENLYAIVLVVLLALASALGVMAQTKNIPKLFGMELGAKSEILTYKTGFNAHSGILDIYTNDENEIQAMIFETDHTMKIDEVKTLRNGLFYYFKADNIIKFDESDLEYYTYVEKHFTLIFAAYANGSKDYVVSITYKLNK